MTNRDDQIFGPALAEAAQNATTEAGKMDASRKNVLDIGDIAELFSCSREKVKRMALRGTAGIQVRQALVCLAK